MAMSLPSSLICVALAVAAVDAGFQFGGGGGGRFWGGGYGYEVAVRPRPAMCEPKDIIVREGFIGWPYRLSCGKLAYDYSDIAYDQFLWGSPPPEHHDTHCLITDMNTSTVVLDKTYRVWSWRSLGYRYPYKLMEDLTPESSTQYKMELKTLSTCTYEDLTLKMMPSPNVTCEEAARTEAHALYRVDVDSSEHVIDCEVNYYHDRMVTSLDRRIHKYNVTWYKDCEEIFPEESNGTYTQVEDTLVFGMVDYSASGTYSCEVSYNGLVRTGQIVDFCVRPPRNVQPPKIRCPNWVRDELNTTVNVTCNVKLSFRPHKNTRPNVQWQQEVGKSHHMCVEYGETESRRFDFRSHCSSEFRAGQECFSHEPSEEEQQSSVQLNFMIDNFTRDDVGEYRVTFRIGKFIVSDTWKLRVKRPKKESKLPEDSH